MTLCNAGGLRGVLAGCVRYLKVRLFLAVSMIPLSAAADIGGLSFYGNIKPTMIQVKTKTIFKSIFVTNTLL